MKPPLAIVGASTRAAAASASRAGFQPIAADLFADVDLRRIATATRISPYPDGFLDWLRTIEPPAWMYTGALENHPELVDQMAWIAPLWGNPGDVLARVRSPLELARTLCAAGLLFPETRASAVGLPRDRSWLAKTYRGASGSGVRVLNAEYKAPGIERDAALQTPTTMPSVSPSPLPAPRSLVPAFFQRHIPGTPCAAVFVAVEGDTTLLGATRQLIGCDWLGAHGFQYAGSIGPLPWSDSASATLETIGNTLAREFELIGLFGVDFILADDEVWTIEVNPRYTASVEIVERITGIQAVSAHAAACGGLRLDKFPKSKIRNPKSAFGKATIFARQDITITPAFAEWSLAEVGRSPWPTLADISAAGTQINAGRPILTVFDKAASPLKLEDRLRARVAEIEQRLYFQH